MQTVYLILASDGDSEYAESVHSNFECAVELARAKEIEDTDEDGFKMYTYRVRSITYYEDD